MKKANSPPPPLPVPPLPDASWGRTAGGQNRDRTVLIILAVIALALVLLLLLWLTMRIGSQSGGKSKKVENSAAANADSNSAGESQSESQSAENEKSADDVADSGQVESVDEPQTAGRPADAESAATQADDEALKQAVDTTTDSGDLAQNAASSATADSGPRHQATIGALGSEGGAEFFGVSADGNRFVFVIDISSSMANGSFIKARDEAVRSIDQLSPSQDFGVVLYHDSPVTNNVFSMCEATDKHKAAFKQWILQQSPTGGTEPTAAMKIAIARKPDAIFLLSDGEFDPKAVQLISGINKSKRVVINTISLSANSSTLKQIADENGGSFRFVP